MSHDEVTSVIDPRVACSSISFRKRPLAEALSVMADLGFESFDLGALPGVCDHVPFELDDAAVADVSATVQAAGLRTLSINADIGDLNRPLSQQQIEERAAHLDRLLALCEGTGSPALVLPCGTLGHDPVRTLDEDLDLIASELVKAAEVANGRGVALWVEILHSLRLCRNIDIASRLHERLAGAPIGVVMDFSHIISTGDDLAHFIDVFEADITHVHIRDAKPGNINISVGRGDVDFRAGIAELLRRGYSGDFSLELETRDVTEDERPAAAAQAGEYISTLIQEES